MKRIILLMNLIAITFMGYCQPAPEKKKLLDIPIVTADTLIRGIYLNFKEFQQNAPSIRTDFRSKEEYLPINNIYDNMIVERMLFRDTNGKFSPLKQDHWGICNGKNIFIKYDGKYQKISIDGKYCPFSASTHPANSSAPTSYYNLLLNISNGEIISFTLKSIKKLIKKEDLSLYKAFDQEQDMRLMMSTYVNLLNQTYVYR